MTESGTSSNPCSGMYGGSHAFSEPCIQNMRGAILEVKDRIRMYMGLYSYDQKWHTPWSADSSKPSDYSDLVKKFAPSLPTTSPPPRLPTSLSSSLPPPPLSLIVLTFCVFQLAVANAGNRALQAVHGTVFQVGTPSEIHGEYQW